MNFKDFPKQKEMSDIHFNSNTLSQWEYLGEGAKHITFTYTDTDTDDRQHSDSNSYSNTTTTDNNINHSSLYINHIIKINNSLLSRLSHYTITLHDAIIEMREILYYSNKVIHL